MLKAVVFLFLACLLQAAEQNSSLQLQDSLSQSEYNTLVKEKQALESRLGEDNIFRKIYSNYETYNRLQSRLERIRQDLREAPKDTAKHAQLLEQKELLEGQTKLLQEYAKNPFHKLIQPKEIENKLEITNPFSIITALSYLKQLESEKESYINRYENLRSLIKALKEKVEILHRLAIRDTRYLSEAGELKDEIDTYNQLLKTYTITKDVYLKELSERTIEIEKEVQQEFERLVVLLLILLGIYIIVALIKQAMKRYISDNERFYLANKSINFTLFTIIVIVIAFRYIENVSHIVTFLGFASAGIAIAMKDWFMSIFGWLVIVFGGSVHVGDRIKVKKDGLVYVGDVIDLSVFRMTLHEDITLTTYLENRRSGRIIFVPNHYIFTSLIANYAHSGMKTVWDGIDFTVTFDSNINKSTILAKEIAKRYAKGYTNISRTQLNKLRSKYHLKNTNVEPRVFSFIEENGVRISVWYMTNAFATLTLRSNISAEIVETIQKEDDVNLAFPTQSIYLDKDVRKPKDTIETGQERNNVIL